MGVIFTESFAWSPTRSDYVAYKNYQTGPPNLMTSGGPGAPWTGAHYTEFDVPGAIFQWNTWGTARSRLIIGQRISYAAPSSGTVDSFIMSSPSSGRLLRWTNSGQFIQIQDSSFNVLATGTHAAFDGGWHYIEIDWNVGGTVIVYVDGVADISVANTATGTIGAHQWGLTGGVVAAYAADIYVVDPATSPNSGPLGDVHIECRRPNGAGASTLWTPNGAPSNWQSVADSSGPDGDVTYVSTAGVGNRDSYALPNINEATPSAIPAVACYIIAEKDNTAPRGVKASIHSGSTDLDGTELLLTDSTYEVASVIAQVDPSTSAAWTVSGANAAKPGILLSS